MGCIVIPDIRAVVNIHNEHLSARTPQANSFRTCDTVAQVPGAVHSFIAHSTLFHEEMKMFKMNHYSVKISLIHVHFNQQL